MIVYKSHLSFHLLYHQVDHFNQDQKYNNYFKHIAAPVLHNIFEQLKVVFNDLQAFLFMIFFIPAKLKLLALDKSVRSKIFDDDRLDKPADIYDTAKSVIVVALPVITGILHYVFDIVTNN